MRLEPNLHPAPLATSSPPEESLGVRLQWRVINFVQAVFLCVWSVFWISLALVLTVLTLNRNVALAMARRCWAPGLLWGTWCRYRVEPLPDVDWSKPHIFAMNHQSMLDIPCAFAFLPANLRFVAKHTLKYVPFLGWYMAMTGMIFVDRSNRHRAVSSLRLAGRRIRDGANILAYPEGTRSLDGRILPFKKGPFVLALEAGVPIIPVAIHGSGDVLSRGGFRIRPREVRLKVGTPIPTAGRTPEQRDALIHEVRQAVSQLQREIGGPGAVAQDIAAAGVEGLGVAPSADLG